MATVVIAVHQLHQLPLQRLAEAAAVHQALQKAALRQAAQVHPEVALFQAVQVNPKVAPFQAVHIASVSRQKAVSAHFQAVVSLRVLPTTARHRLPQLQTRFHQLFRCV